MANEGQGWHGDSKGHADAAKGNGTSDDNSSSGSQQGNPGWQGESERHSEAAKSGQSEGLIDKVKDVLSGSGDDDDGKGQGWHGDSEGHSEAAKK